jgi:hypothetical protein
MENFWSGFVKEGYDYAHEVRLRNEAADYDSKRSPIPYGKSMAIGAGLGGITGAGMGAFSAAKGSRLGGGLKGGAMGAGIGLLAGALTALSDDLEVADAKRLMAMEPEARDAELASRARKDEIHQREIYEQRRHRQMMRELRGEQYG